MSELTLADLPGYLADLSRQFAAKQLEVEQLDRTATLAKHAYKQAYFEALLRAEGGSVDMKKASAEVQTGDLSLASEMADQVLRAGREAVKVLSTRIEIGRSIASILKLEFQG
jgi:hypothetical protein